MSGELPIPITLPGIEGEREKLLSFLAAFSQLEKETRKAADAGEASRASFGQAAQSMAAVVSVAQAAYDALSRVAEGMVASAAEGQQLALQSARLGLDFDEASDAAGRFTDETLAMSAATRLNEAGLRLSQDQLNGLTRVAASFAQNTGVEVREAVDRLTEGLIAGSERGLRPFGGELAASAGHTGTMTTRLAALTAQAGHTAQATDDARTSMERFHDSIEDAERTFATSFVEGLVRLNSVERAEASTAEKAAEMQRNIRAAGDTAAEVATRAAHGVAVILGSLATGVAGILSGIQAIGAGIAHLGNFTDRRSMADVMRASFRDSPIMQAVGDFTAGHVDALERLAGESDPRTSAAPVTPAAPAATPAPAGRGRGSRGRTQRRGADMAFTLEQTTQADFGEHAADRAIAEADDARRVAALTLRLEHEAEADQRSRAAQAARDSFNAHRSAESDPASAARRREQAFEQRQLEQRLDHMQSFTERWRDLHSQQVDATQMAAEGISGAFASMGEALGKHVQALVDGKESVGEALQGMLADTLSAIGKQAIVKGSMEFAEGLAALAGVVTAPLAPGHFAAGAAYMAVGAAASVAGSALAPSAPASASATPTRASSSRATDVMSPHQKWSADGGPQVVNHFYAPVVNSRSSTDYETGNRLGRLEDASARRQTRPRA